MSAPSDTGSEAGRPGPTDDTPTVDAATTTNPFPGPRPFAESDEMLFFGRERELSDLVALLFAHRAVLLHAPSGAGKSSLVSAGLIPRARRRGFEFLPVARVRGTGTSGDDPAGNRYVHNVVDTWRAAGLVLPSHAASLSEVLVSLPRADEPGRVVVFDQIEELFVLHPDRWRDRGDLFSQVQEALDHDPLLHFLFVLRDDYLAWLQPFAPRLRDRLSARYHLGGLSPAQALEAVVKPLATTGRVFAPGVAEAFVTALREEPVDLPVNRSYESEDVEPVQLQIVCRTFFERLPRAVTEISTEHVASHADVQQALVGFYEQAIAAAVKSRAGVRERRLRLWFERQLITPARTRGIVFQGERTTAGLPNNVVDELERRRIVRSEPRGPALWYELTHDRLIDAVLGSNRVWYAKRSRTVTRRAAAAVAAFGLLAAVVSLVAFHSRSNGSASGASEPKKSRISVPGQTIDFPVRGRARHLLTAVMIPDEGFAGELRLFDVQGRPIGQPSTAQSKPLLALMLPTDGDYRVQARGRGSSTGSFLLTLAAQTVDARAQLTGSDPVPGSITAPDEVDIYTFAGRAGAIAKITMRGQPDCHLVMVGPGGQGFYEVDNISGHSVIAAVLPRDGRYELHAFSRHSTIGAYQLQLVLPDDSAAAAGELTGTMTTRDPTALRTIQSTAGGALTVSYPRQQGIDDVSLVATDGDTLVADSGQGGFRWLIAPATTYLLVASNHFDHDLSYSISLAITESVPLAGGRAQGQLSHAGQFEVYWLDSEPGDMATILASPAGQFDLIVTVVEPDGTILIQKDTGGPGKDELFTATMQQSGRHLIAISGSGSHGTGRFRIAVTQSKATAPPP